MEELCGHTRLNQTMRGKWGCVYPKMVQNNFQYAQSSRDLFFGYPKPSESENTNDNSNMEGSGIYRDIIKKSYEKNRPIANRLRATAMNENSNTMKMSGNGVIDVTERAFKKIKNVTPKVQEKIKMHTDFSNLKPQVIMKEIEEEDLPGQRLKKKIMRKMALEKKRKKQTGGNKVVETNSDGSSADKTLPSTSSYTLNPKPLVGAGKKQHSQKGGFIFALPLLGAHLAAGPLALLGGTVLAAAPVVAGALGGTTATAVGSSLITGAASALGGVAVKKLLGDGIKTKLIEKVKSTKLGIKDLDTVGKKALMTAYKKLKKYPPAKEAVKIMKDLGKHVMKAITLKAVKSLGMKGKGLSLAGSGLKLGPGLEKQFIKNLIKNASKKK